MNNDYKTNSLRNRTIIIFVVLALLLIFIIGIITYFLRPKPVENEPIVPVPEEPPEIVETIHPLNTVGISAAGTSMLSEETYSMTDFGLCWNDVGARTIYLKTPFQYNECFWDIHWLDNNISYDINKYVTLSTLVDTPWICELNYLKRFDNQIEIACYNDANHSIQLHSCIVDCLENIQIAGTNGYTVAAYTPELVGFLSQGNVNYEQCAVFLGTTYRSGIHSKHTVNATSGFKENSSINIVFEKTDAFRHEQGVIGYEITGNFPHRAFKDSYSTTVEFDGNVQKESYSAENVFNLFKDNLHTYLDLRREVIDENGNPIKSKIYFDNDYRVIDFDRNLLTDLWRWGGIPFETQDFEQIEGIIYDVYIEWIDSFNRERRTNLCLRKKLFNKYCDGPSSQKVDENYARYRENYFLYLTFHPNYYI